MVGSCVATDGLQFTLNPKLDKKQYLVEVCMKLAYTIFWLLSVHSCRLLVHADRLV